jgi:hypothetical protein
MASSDSYGSSYYSSANSSYPSWDKSVKYKYGGGSSQGGKNMIIGPEMVVGGIGALVGGIGSAIGANAQAKSAERMARWQIEAEERARFQGLLAGQNAATYGKQFDMGLQRDAANYQQAFLDPRKSILNAEDFTRRAAAELSPFGQKLSQKEQSNEIQRTLAGKYNGMFGQINQSPFMFGQKPGYTTSSFV